MRKFLSLVLAVAAVMLALVSCSDTGRKYDADEVKTAAKPLIEKSAVLNEIYWGAGIGWSENDQNGFYYSARPEELKRLGVKSVEDLKVQTLATFSLSYSESIFSAVLNSLGDEDTGILGYTRYFQDGDKLMVFSKYEPLLRDEVTYLYDTITVTGSKDETVFVSIDVRIRRADAEQIRTLEIGLIEELGEWRIDTPTYMSYAENKNNN